MIIAMNDEGRLMKALEVLSDLQGNWDGYGVVYGGKTRNEGKFEAI